MGMWWGGRCSAPSVTVDQALVRLYIQIISDFCYFCILEYQGVCDWAIYYAFNGEYIIKIIACRSVLYVAPWWTILSVSVALISLSLLLCMWLSFLWHGNLFAQAKGDGYFHFMCANACFLVHTHTHTYRHEANDDAHYMMGLMGHFPGCRIALDQHFKSVLVSQSLWVIHYCFISREFSVAVAIGKFLRCILLIAGKSKLRHCWHNGAPQLPKTKS